MSSLVQFEYTPTNISGVEFLNDVKIGDLTLKNLQFDTSCIDSWYDIFKPWKGIVVMYNDIVFSHNNCNVYCHPIIHIINWNEIRSSPLFKESIKILYFPEMEKSRIVKAMKIIYSRYFLKEYISKYMNILGNMIDSQSLDYSLPIIFNMHDLNIKNVVNYNIEFIYLTFTYNVEYDETPKNKVIKRSSNKYALLAEDEDSEDDN